MAIVKFSAVHAPRTWPPDVAHCLEMIATVFAQVVARQQRDEALQAAMEETQRLKNQLQVENVYLRHEARERLGPAVIVGESAALRQVLAQVEQVAATDSTVLLLGETGTGQGAVRDPHPRARAAARTRPMVRVNCAAIPADADRKRAVRPREGRVHRRAGAADRPVRAGRPLDDLPRRDRRPAARRAGEAAARARGAEDRAAGQPAADSRGHADHRRDPSQSRAARRRGIVSRGPVLPPERVPDSRAAAPRAGRGHSAAGVAVRRGVLEGVRQAHRVDRQRRPWRRCSSIPGRATSASCATSSSAR